MKNIGKKIFYKDVKECKNEIQCGWYLSMTTLISQDIVKENEINAITLTPCNSVLWNSLKITCKKSCLKARKVANENIEIIWIKVLKIFYLTFSSKNETNSPPEELLYLQGR